MKWYILKVAKGRDHAVKDSIERILDKNNLTKYVSNILVPVEKYANVIKGKRVVKERSLLGGYVLLHADFSYDHVITVILEVKGALGFMGVARNVPDVIPDNQIERLIGKTEDRQVKMDIGWMTGEHVKIVDGPFSSFDAIIKTVDDSKQRIKADVKIFGRTTLVDLDYASIQKI